MLLAAAFVTLLKLYRIPSSAMEPTLRCARPDPGCSAKRSDRVAAVRLDWPFEGVGRGDVVFFRTPPQAKERCGSGGTFVERVVGLPGEIWAERTGVIFIDGRPLDEPYVDDEHRDERRSPPRRIPPGHYLVLGDNRVQSCDSRVWGPLPKKNIVAKALVTYWPPGRIAFR